MKNRYQSEVWDMKICGNCGYEVSRCDRCGEEFKGMLTFCKDGEHYCCECRDNEAIPSLINVVKGM